MKQQYVIINTASHNAVEGTQVASTAQRAIDLFTKRRQLSTTGLAAIPTVDWQPGLTGIPAGYAGLLPRIRF